MGRLRALLSRYVPSEYFERKKQGFSIPIFAWFSLELDAMFETYLSAEYVNRTGILNGEEVQKEYQKFLNKESITIHQKDLSHLSRTEISKKLVKVIEDLQA